MRHSAAVSLPVDGGGANNMVCGCPGLLRGKSRVRKAHDPSSASLEVSENQLERVETKGVNTLSRVNQYSIEQKLGKGAFGAVYRATDLNKELVAIKVMEKSELRKASGAGLRRAPGSRPGMAKPGTGSTIVSMTILKEIAVMKRVRHVNCVRLFEARRRASTEPHRSVLRGGVGMASGTGMGARGHTGTQAQGHTGTRAHSRLRTPGPQPYARLTPRLRVPTPRAMVGWVSLAQVIDDPVGDRIFLVMELLEGGEVMAESNLPAHQNYLEESQARLVFRDLLDGLEYLHGNGILHRDIKPVRRPPTALPPPSRRPPCTTPRLAPPRLEPSTKDITRSKKCFQGGVDQVGGVWHVETLADGKLDSSD